jgi:DNA (cytosine-5)-methyltransferase 1
MIDRLMREYALIDVFSGCGGMTAGFVDSSRFSPILSVDSDPAAAATYALNFGGDHMQVGLIEEISSFPKADVVIGGPPCQAFSLLNRQRVGAERRELWRQYLRVLEQSRASAFVMENVPALLRSIEYAQFAEASKSLGFEVSGRVLNAADFGGPQTRRRAFVIGVRGGNPVWPLETHRPPDANSSEPTWRTFADAVAGLPVKPSGLNWHVSRRPRPESLRRYRAVPRNGGDRFQMQRNLERAGLGQLVPPCWRDKTSGTTDVFGRLWWDRPAVTIRTEFYKPEKGRYLHPSAHRAITIREGARCMGFRDNFSFPQDQSMTAVGRQVGNAVPPPLAERLATVLAETLDALGVAD